MHFENKDLGGTVHGEWVEVGGSLVWVLDGVVEVVVGGNLDEDHDGEPGGQVVEGGEVHGEGVEEGGQVEVDDS